MSEEKLGSVSIITSGDKTVIKYSKSNSSLNIMCDILKRLGYAKKDEFSGKIRFEKLDGTKKQVAFVNEDQIVITPPINPIDAEIIKDTFWDKSESREKIYYISAKQSFESAKDNLLGGRHRAAMGDIYYALFNALVALAYLLWEEKSEEFVFSPEQKHSISVRHFTGERIEYWAERLINGERLFEDEAIEVKLGQNKDGEISEKPDFFGISPVKLLVRLSKEYFLTDFKSMFQEINEQINKFIQSLSDVFKLQKWNKLKDIVSEDEKITINLIEVFYVAYLTREYADYKADFEIKITYNIIAALYTICDNFLGITEKILYAESESTFQENKKLEVRAIVSTGKILEKYVKESILTITGIIFDPRFSVSDVGKSLLVKHGYFPTRALDDILDVPTPQNKQRVTPIIIQKQNNFPAFVTNIVLDPSGIFRIDLISTKETIIKDPLLLEKIFMEKALNDLEAAISKDGKIIHGLARYNTVSETAKSLLNAYIENIISLQQASVSSIFQLLSICMQKIDLSFLLDVFELPTEIRFESKGVYAHLPFELYSEDSEKIMILPTNIFIYSFDEETVELKLAESLEIILSHPILKETKERQKLLNLIYFAPSLEKWDFAIKHSIRRFSTELEKNTEMKDLKLFFIIPTIFELGKLLDDMISFPDIFSTNKRQVGKVTYILSNDLEERAKIISMEHRGAKSTYLYGYNTFKRGT